MPITHETRIILVDEKDKVAAQAQIDVAIKSLEEAGFTIGNCLYLGDPKDRDRYFFMVMGIRQTRRQITGLREN